MIVPERIGERRYTARSPGEMGDHLFGGQVIAQGLAAANQEGDGRPAHSLHAYFLRRGTPAEPIHFEVTELRHSRAFRTFGVVASQGEPILQMGVSYHDEEEGPAHQIPMDEVDPPGGEAYETALLGSRFPGIDPDESAFELPIEIRGVGGIGMFSDEVRPPQSRCWIRARGALPDDPLLHQCLFAYASDYAIMASAIAPHPLSATTIQSASLDHAIWFHRPLRMDAWQLLEADSPITHGARGIGRGLLYTEGGTLVASCVQEALMRPRREG